MIKSESIPNLAILNKNQTELQEIYQEAKYDQEKMDAEIKNALKNKVKEMQNRL